MAFPDSSSVLDKFRSAIQPVEGGSKGCFFLPIFLVVLGFGVLCNC